jgi:TolB-like protein/cytochrome c-type biogenesis protein CcmH/NrfG
MNQASQPAYGGLSASVPENSEMVRKAVDKVTSSAVFADSQRMARFLRFAAEETLQGNGGRLKEIVIGVEVFDRGANYDPRLDPIVRVEARRLRAKLLLYYEGEGKDDEVVIEFPKGTYQPVFRVRQKQVEMPSPEPAVKHRVATIAILPFANLDPEPEQQYFSDGLTEELIHALTRIRELRVMAWNTASHFRADQDMASVRTRLGVAYALRGAVRRTGQRLRVTAQLIDTATGEYLWSETYNREILDVFAIQEQIAAMIVNALQLRLGDAACVSSVQPQRNLECYNLCLKGRFHTNERSPEGLRRAAICFQQAVAVDGSSASAYAGLADTYTMLADYGFVKPGDVMETAKAAAEKAIKFDPNSAEAHTSLAWIRSHYEWRWPDAGRLYRRAMELNPGYATAHHWYATDYLAMLGRFEEAMPEVEIALALDPLSVIIQECKAYLMLLARKYDDALAEYSVYVESDPSFYRGYTALGRTYIQMERYNEAVAMLEKGRRLAGNHPSILGALGQAYGFAGRSQEALGVLADLAHLAETSYAPCTALALVHIGLGNRAEALDYLEKGAELRDLRLSAIKIHPAYDRLRGEPRFQRLIDRIGFDGF